MPLRVSNRARPSYRFFMAVPALTFLMCEPSAQESSGLYATELPLDVQIEATSESFDNSEKILLNFQMTNRASVRLKVLSWDTPFEDRR